VYIRKSNTESEKDSHCFSNGFKRRELQLPFLLQRLRSLKWKFSNASKATGSGSGVWIGYALEQTDRISSGRTHQSPTTSGHVLHSWPWRN